jgi:hypothetical protein
VVSDRPNYNPTGRIALDPVTGNWRSFSIPLDYSGLMVMPWQQELTPARQLDAIRPQYVRRALVCELESGSFHRSRAKIQL